MPRIEPFEEHSLAYDRWFEDHKELYEAELKAIGEIIPKELAMSVEIGVGSARFAAPLGVRFGLDPSRMMLKKAMEQGISVCLGVAEELPFSDQSFDLVLMVTTICFVDSIDAAFAEAYRIIKPDGCIVVGFVDKDSPLGRQYQARKNESKFYRHATFYSTEEVLLHLKRADFTIDAIRQTLLPGQSTSIVLDGYGSGSFIAIRALK